MSRRNKTRQIGKRKEMCMELKSVGRVCMKTELKVLINKKNKERTYIAFFCACLEYLFKKRCDNLAKKRKSFHINETRSWQYHTATLTNTNYTDDVELLANITAKAESLLMCSKQIGTTSTLSNRSAHISRQQYLINWKRCQHTHREVVECDWQTENLISLIK